MDQGTKDLSGLREDVAASGHPAWIRAVAATSLGEQPRLLFALVIVGPEPEEWSATSWPYEQCHFASGSSWRNDDAELISTFSEEEAQRNAELQHYIDDTDTDTDTDDIDADLNEP